MASSQPVNRRQDQSEDRWLAFVGDCPKVTNYISNSNKSPRLACIKFANALFRGYGQVVFANNPFSGILVMIALFWADYEVGFRGLYSSVIALTFSIALRHPKDAIENGLTVFNPLLLGQVCGALLPGRFGIEFEIQHWVFLAIGSIMTVYVAACLSSLLGSIGEFPIPCLALPFCVVQFLFFVTAIHLNIPSPMNTTALTTSAEIISTSDNILSAALERNVLQEETSSEFSLPHIDLSTTLKTVSTSSIQSTPKENMSTSKTNLEAEALWLNTTNSNADNHTALAEGDNNITETYYMHEVVTEAGNITQDNNNSTIINQTLEVRTRNRRDIAKQTSNDGTDEVDTEEKVDRGQIFAGIILSMTQVFGACHVPAAVMIYLAVLLYSPITAVFCLVGAMIATVTGIGLSSAPYDLVYNGVWGFNGLLIAAAFSFFFINTWQSMIMTIISVVFGTVLQNLLMLSMEESNLPVVSIPFNLTVMLFLCLGPDRNGRGIIRPSVLSFPEKHRDNHFRPRGQVDQANNSNMSVQFIPERDTEKRAPLAEQEVV